jgi:mannose-1-phosphate guanylyltransferase
MPSPFQHAVDRASKLTAPDRTVVVATRQHQQEIWRQLETRLVGTVLLQPKNAGTAAGIFLPLTYIREQDPDATVIIHPSDRFVHPEDRFLACLERATWAARILPDRPILLATPPQTLEAEYGWIQPGRILAWSGRDPVRTVEAFIENPAPSDARRIGEADGLWNTLALTARVESLWELGWRCVPDVMRLFKPFKAALDTPEEFTVLESLYAAMPRRDFSADLLQRAADRLAVLVLDDILWSDWGEPERVIDTLHKIGTPSALEEDLVALEEK